MQYKEDKFLKGWVILPKMVYHTTRNLILSRSGGKNIFHWRTTWWHFQSQSRIFEHPLFWKLYIETRKNTPGRKMKSSGNTTTFGGPNFMMTFMYIIICKPGFGVSFTNNSAQWCVTVGMSPRGHWKTFCSQILTWSDLLSEDIPLNPDDTLFFFWDALCNTSAPPSKNTVSANLKHSRYFH